MRKSSLPVAVKTLLKYKNEETLDFNNPVQRNSGQWSNLQQSLFIHSILADFIVPNVYFIKDGKNISVLEGKQRLSTVFSYINDEFALHSKTPIVESEGEVYDIAHKKFSELHEDLRASILQYRFGTYQLEDCSDTDIEETFTRLNNGTALSKIQMARPKLGVELASYFNELAERSFFQNALNLTLAQLRREDEFLMLLTSVMVIDMFYYDDFRIKTSASAAECVRFAEYINNNYSDEKRQNIKDVIDYLDEAFGDECYKYLRKNNVPVVMYAALICMKYNVDASDFKVDIDCFFEDVPSEYDENSGSGNVKLFKLKKRLEVLLSYVIDNHKDLFEGSENVLDVFWKEC